MIVNPQLFNYRLIIGSLIITVASISTVGYFSYKSLETEKKFLENENQLIRNELDYVLLQYNEVTGINNELTQEIENSEKIFQFKLDSLTSLEVTKSQSVVDAGTLASTIKSTNYFKGLSDSLKKENTSLNNQNGKLEEELASSRSENLRLEDEIDRIKDRKSSTPSVSINTFNVTTYRINSGKKTISFKANNANSFELCLQLNGERINELTGEIYVQILDPSNNVISDKGAASFGDASLIYSGKYSIQNLVSGNDVCLNIETDQNDRPLKKGKYRVNVFHDKTMLGNTTIELN